MKAYMPWVKQAAKPTGKETPCQDMLKIPDGGQPDGEK